MSTNTSFSVKDLEYLAKLAKLKIDKDEAVKYEQQLGEILGYVGQLGELDLVGVRETSQVTGLVNVMAEDIAKPGLDRDEVLSQANKKADGYVMVKAIFGENEE
jgi:aspartyl-tRNA(Asn)/glutamyl-tRNA(Gln) amidotransferase subunit C